MFLWTSSSTNLENFKGSLDVEILKIRQIREELKNSFLDLDILSIPSTPIVLDDKSLGDSLKDLSKCMETQMDKVKWQGVYPKARVVSATIGLVAQGGGDHSTCQDSTGFLNYWKFLFLGHLIRL